MDLGLNWAVAALPQSRKPRGRLLSLGLNKKYEINQGRRVFVTL